MILFTGLTAIILEMLGCVFSVHYDLFFLLEPFFSCLSAVVVVLGGEAGEVCVSIENIVSSQAKCGSALLEAQVGES